MMIELNTSAFLSVTYVTIWTSHTHGLFLSFLVVKVQVYTRYSRVTVTQLTMKNRKKKEITVINQWFAFNVRRDLVVVNGMSELR